MPANRFYIDAPFIPGERHTLPKDEHRHLRVMRIKPGETIELVNGRHELAKASVLEEEVEITDVQISTPPLPLILCQALPRMNRLDTIVEKGTELGMTALWLFPGEKSEKKALSETQLKRLKTITISAMKQSGRLDLPPIELHPPIAKWTTLPKTSYFGDLHPEASPFQQVWTHGATLIVIGPEAGLTGNEEKILRQLGAKGVKLHPHILRTDTAPLAALSLVSHWSL